jgi:hypothetical protein
MQNVVCENSLFGRYTSANFPPAFACIQVKRCPGSHRIQGGSVLQFPRLRRYPSSTNVQRLNNLQKSSKAGKSKGAYDREPSMDAGHHIDLESPHFPTSDSLPTPQSRSSHWRMRKYWDASSIRDHWPCRKLWIDHDPASQAVRTSHAFHDQTTANMTECLNSFQSHWKSF